MLSVLLIIEELEMRNKLLEQINKSNPKYEVAGVTRGVRESIKWLNSWGAPDLIVSALRFTDGFCYDILRQSNLYCPVIFIPTDDTSLDEYAGHTNTTAYLKQAPSMSRLITALDRFQSDRQQILTNIQAVLPANYESKRQKTRIIIKKGKEFYPVFLKDVVLIYFENGIVYLINSEMKKFMVNADGLNLVYNNLDRSIFYRANRKYIFNVNYLSNYKSIGNNRILIELMINSPENIIISQYRSNEFRSWIEQLSINSGNAAAQ